MSHAPVQVEGLESRRLFSIGVVDGVLTVTGTKAGERIGIAWRQTGDSTWLLKVSDGRQTRDWGWSGNNSWNSVYLYGGNGDDYLSATATIRGFTNTFNPPVPVVMNGGAANDTLHGGENADTLFGGSGDDFLFGHGGNDVIRGESGADSINAANGNDTVFGGDGNDSIRGDAGNDVLRGDADDDDVDGGTGDDLVIGGTGRDALFAGTLTQPPFYRAGNLDDGSDTLFGSDIGDPDDSGDERFF